MEISEEVTLMLQIASMKADVQLLEQEAAARATEIDVLEAMWRRHATLIAWNSLKLSFLREKLGDGLAARIRLPTEWTEQLCTMGTELRTWITDNCLPPTSMVEIVLRVDEETSIFDAIPGGLSLEKILQAIPEELEQLLCEGK